MHGLQEEETKRVTRARRFGTGVYNPQAAMDGLTEEEFGKMEARSKRFGVTKDVLASVPLGR